MITLKLGFITDNLSMDYLSIKDVRDDIILSEITAYANDIIAQNIFSPTKGAAYVTLSSIQKVTTVTENLL